MSGLLKQVVWKALESGGLLALYHCTAQWGGAVALAGCLTVAGAAAEGAWHYVEGVSATHPARLLLKSSSSQTTRHRC